MIACEKTTCGMPSSALDSVTAAKNAGIETGDESRMTGGHEGHPEGAAHEPEGRLPSKHDAQQNHCEDAFKDDSDSLSSDDLQTDEPGPKDLEPRPSVVATNLETIKEEEVLEITATAEGDAQPIEVKPWFTFDDSVSECESIRRDSNRFLEYEDGDEEGDEDDDDEDDASVLSLPAELPSPPDGGWGWVIVAVSFCINMVVDGIAYSFSPFLESFSQHFQEPRGKVAWIASLLAGVYLAVGPVVSALSNKFGCRIVCSLGAVIGCLAYVSTVFAPSVVYLMITQGIIAGFGFGMMYLPAVVSVSYYFESKRALATGIAVCGSGFGTIVMPPIVNYLVHNLDWKGTNLVLAGIILCCSLCGFLMRPLEVVKMQKKDLLHRLAEEKKAALEVGSMYGSNYFAVTLADGTVERRPRKSLNPDPGVHSHLNLSGFLTPTATSLGLPTIQENRDNTVPDPPIATIEGDSVQSKVVQTSDANGSAATAASGDNQKLINKAQKTVPRRRQSQKFYRNCSQPVMEEGCAQMIPANGSVPNFERKLSKIDVVAHMKDPEMQAFKRRTAKGKAMVLRPMSRQDIFYSGSITNLREFKSQNSMLSYRESTLNLKGTGASKAVIDALDGASDDGKKSCIPESIMETLQEMVDLSLMKNPVFLIICIANVIGMLGFYTPFVYLPSAAVEKGITKEMSMYLVSVIGISNTIGRVLCGVIADLPCVSALWINNICLALCAVCVFVIPFAQSFGSLAFVSVLFGFFVAGFVAVTSIIFVDLFGLKKLTNAFGLLCVFRGTAAVLGPPLSGSVYDATSSYDVSFFMAGAMLFTASVLHCLIPLFEKCFLPTHLTNKVEYATNEDYMSEMPRERRRFRTISETSPESEIGMGIVLDIKPKAGEANGQNGIPGSE